MKHEELIGWEPPDFPFFKLSTDIPSRGNPGLSGAGGFIKNHNGYWITIFSRRVSIATNNMAEAWALRDGLQSIAQEIP
ncbi:hypothetical protein ACH5RR_003741 [Cinchona calisaya]|uniref:RNase H type-1 domain-containing protein n=1 Tax=Cinchona calisaya TaxID=153742 RepID=A0ABD3AVW9_9GENT